MTYEISVIELIELSSYVERDFAFCAVCESLFASISVRSGFFEDQNGFLFEKGISILFSKGPGTLAKEKGVVKQKQKPLSTGRLLGDTQRARISRFRYIQHT
ncbi:MAG TPA: hypothetical protein DCE42_08840 [Myxococcales bacterium]|nr:hypothetical protein [Deltaproteobacteria bacterium]HAA54852.1 hypothetical protein [Myxococcales bacterium]